MNNQNDEAINKAVNHNNNHFENDYTDQALSEIADNTELDKVRNERRIAEDLFKEFKHAIGMVFSDVPPRKRQREISESILHYKRKNPSTVSVAAADYSGCGK